MHTKSAQVPTTNEMGLELFLSQIMKNPIKDHIVTAILNQIRHERDGNVINRSVVKECVDVFQSLQYENTPTATIYKRDLEPPLLEASKVFYLKEGQELANSYNTPDFLRLVCVYFLLSVV